MMMWNGGMLCLDRRSLLSLPFLLLPNGRAFSQSENYPDRTVTIVFPYTSGGLIDALARIVATKLQQRFNKSFVVENRPGGASVVGTLSVVRSVPDGYTILLASTAIASNVNMLKIQPYDPIKDLVPIALIARIPQVLIVNAELPVRSLPELVEFARSKPGGLTFASAGVGTSPHLCGEMLKLELKINLTHLPYRGNFPAIQDVAGGHADLMFSDILNAIPLAQTGKIHMIGVSVSQRVQIIPDIPSLAELGVPGFDLAGLFLFAVPIKTPKAIINILHTAIRETANDSTVRHEFSRRGAIPIDSPTENELVGFLQSEIARWGEIIRKTGLAGSL
jgi:tripartite-type tricarboxylate transporter receptor subunit TctC